MVTEVMQHIPILLPLLGIGNLQHAIGSFGDGIKSIESVEVDSPTRGYMLDSDEVVAKDHLGYRDSKLLIHSIDGTGLENGSLARTDSPLLVARNNSADTLGVLLFSVGSHGLLIRSTKMESTSSVDETNLSDLTEALSCRMSSE
jgi:hypothetical protein